MQIKIFLERENKTQKVNLKAGAKIADLLKQLKINKEEVITIINNEIVTENEKIKEKDNVKFLSVISGG